MMTIDKSIKILEKYQAWRMDDGYPSKKMITDPKEVGRAIDFAIRFMKSNN